MRSMVRAWFLMSLTLGVLTACGPSTGTDEAATPSGEAQVEQEIGTDPNCPISQMQSMVTWQAACGTPCSNTAGYGDPGTTNSGYGLPGTKYKRCCPPGGSCTAWKLIGPVCQFCELQ
ncbi:hypothetical protein JYK02_13550 [Corallococcus macrosporus]|uniref:Lipoprotein n=1 Tax=Corallococcus macrosporus TaxID=35 RepID=A0ABS3DA23_9BACT|nr:hypothetical protein [Corallococcus macrosporus]MBN8228531.1 hypothetical protein [Corallococcus macrosporus]